MSRNDEYHLQAQICDYLRLQYPDALWQSDLSGIKLTVGQAVKVKRIKYGKYWPDLIVFEPRGGYNGLAIEIKRNGPEIYTRDGRLRQTAHIQGQAEMLARFRERGYMAEFVCGFDEAQQMIDGYTRGHIPF